MENLKEIFLLAKLNNQQAIETLITRFSPLMHKMAWKTGNYDEDCFQECAVAFLISIAKFEIRK
jgi:hypothetical protein